MKEVEVLLKNGVNLQKSLELFGDMETYNETLADFVKEIDEKLEKLIQYKEVADMNNYSILVHSFKSDAKYFGFEKMAELCFQHEQESKINNIYFVYENFDDLLKEIKRTLVIMEEYLGVEVEKEEEKEKIEAPTKGILVVDDATTIQEFVKKIFKNEYAIVSASDGEEAIKLLTERDSKNLIGMLLDLNMPHVDGFEVLNFFHERNLFDTMSVAIITGEGNESVVTEALKFPVIDVLLKPFNERDVKAIVEKMILDKENK